MCTQLEIICMERRGQWRSIDMFLICMTECKFFKCEWNVELQLNWSFRTMLYKNNSSFRAFFLNCDSFCRVVIIFTDRIRRMGKVMFSLVSVCLSICPHSLPDRLRTQRAVCLLQSRRRTFLFLRFVLISERPFQKSFASSSSSSSDTFCHFYKFSTYASIKLAPMWNTSKLGKDFGRSQKIFAMFTLQAIIVTL